MEIYRAHVLCCGGTGCTSSGSAQIIERFEQKIKENGLDKEVCAKRVPLLSSILKAPSTPA